MTEQKLRIDSEGVFISCFRGQTRVWEFHPDDVISVGVYYDNDGMREVIVAGLHDFEVAQGTHGFRELNERLSTELKFKIRVDAEHGLSRSGVVLWPPHLAGNALWEFYFIGRDGLARYVSPDTPNVEKNLYGPIRREMARNANTQFPREFPPQLVERAFVYHGELSWDKGDALLAAEWLRGRGAAILDAELWLVKNAVVQPHVQTASGVVAYRYWTTTRPSETWEAFADRTLSDVTAFVLQFQWPDNSTEAIDQEVRFSLHWVWREWIEEDGFRFPD